MAKSDTQKELTEEQKDLQQLKIDAISIGMIAGKDFPYNINKENLLIKVGEYQETLAAAYAAKMAKQAPRKPLPTNLPVTAPPNETKNMRRARMVKEARRNRRVVIVCNNPDKREWDGEVMSCGNSFIGQTKKFVPFNTDTPYHVPQILLDMVLDRKCSVYKTIKDKFNNESQKQGLIKEFSVTYVDELTRDEHKDIATLQQLEKGKITED